jgi:putative inorganic carbon (HCO3(-)) transporter
LTGTTLTHVPPRWNTALRELGWWTGAILASAALAWLTLRSLQLGCTVAVVVLTVGLYVRNRAAGLTCVWLLWLLSPWLRRLFGLTGPYIDSDPLALAPFLATGAVAAIELLRAPVSRTAKRVMGMALLGYAIGVPAGAGAPESMAFALFAYVAAVGAFAIGYREPPDRALTLRMVLVVMAPVLALYGIGQYLQPLPTWDALWVESVGDTLNSIGAPEEGKIRVFATLNSPGTFAMVLGLSAVCCLAVRRLGPGGLVSLAAIFGAMAFTFVRSAWVALIAALLAILVASRGHAVLRIGLVVGLVVVAAAAYGGKSTTGEAVVGRFNTLGGLNSDTSARARVATPSEVVPQAVAQPLGSGLGSAGEASKLGARGSLRATDNAWLSLLYQVGPFGFLLVIGAATIGARNAVATILRSRDPRDVLTFALLAFLFVAAFTSDIYYGITGVVTWYLFGSAVRRSEWQLEAEAAS